MCMCLIAILYSNVVFVHNMLYSYMKYACVYNIYVSEMNSK